MTIMIKNIVSSLYELAIGLESFVLETFCIAYVEPKYTHIFAFSASRHASRSCLHKILHIIFL